VDTRTPDVPIQAHLTEDHLILYLDTSGQPLFKRGDRRASGEAPLRENLAAGILRLAGWTPEIPLLDPMCGGGTILVEAASMARGTAPGAGRPFAFEKLKNFDARLWQQLRRESDSRRSPKGRVAIYGSDISGAVLKAAQVNLAAAGLEGFVRLRSADVLDIAAPEEEGMIVTNPPYGVRLGQQQQLAEFYPKLGDLLKKRFSGWTAYLFTADMRLPKMIRLAASRRIPLFNGALECRLFEYRMVEGGLRKKRKPPDEPR
jgi:putative N6-adenine-specific DNA methylase